MTAGVTPARVDSHVCDWAQQEWAQWDAGQGPALRRAGRPSSWPSPARRPAAARLSQPQAECQSQVTVRAVRACPGQLDLNCHDPSQSRPGALPVTSQTPSDKLPVVTRPGGDAAAARAIRVIISPTLSTAA